MDEQILENFRFERTNILYSYVCSIQVRKKRTVFAAMRQANNDPETYVPSLGITLGEFCVYYVLSE